MTSQLSRKDRIRVLIICSMSLFIVGLDITVVNVALPSIARDLNTGVAGLQWTIDAYTVVIASLLMFAGSVADRVGRKRILLTGLAVFLAGSLLCSVAPSVEGLVAARVIQAIGGSMLNPVAMSIIANTFTDPRERAHAVGIWGSTFGISIALGPVIGGVTVSAFDWRAIFWINGPVLLAAILLTLRFVPESRSPRPRRFDPAGQLLVFGFLATLTYGIIEARSQGWTSPVIVAAFAVSAAALGGLVFYERRREEPLIDPRFFRSIPLSSAITLAVTGFAAFGGFLFLNTLYLQAVRGLSPVEAGLATLPMAVVAVIVAPLSGRMVGERGPRVPLAIAGIAWSVGFVMLTSLGTRTSFAWLFGAYVLVGLGLGFLNAPITNTAVSGMPRAQAGVAAALATTSRQVGQTIGVAAIGAIGAFGASQSVQGRPAVSDSAWWTLSACGVVVLVVGLVATTSRARESARRTAAELNPEAVGA